jgi:hypothetical protein
VEGGIGGYRVVLLYELDVVPVERAVLDVDGLDEGEKLAGVLEAEGGVGGGAANS